MAETTEMPVSPATGFRRAGRWTVRIVAAWVGVFVVVNVVILLVGVAARVAGKDPRLHDDTWPGVPNLRLVDDRLLVGGQPSDEDYRALAAKGVTLVVDLRPGTDGGPRSDDAAHLSALGIRYAAVPVVDGRAPTPSQVHRVIELVRSNDGLVFAHCGGGVGRAGSIAASYEAANGDNPSVLEQVATGPPTIEQIWYVAALAPNHPEHDTNPVVATVSRAVDMPRTIFNDVTG
jgi:protein tyrosine phosphatase (PTP) superfamily phosphohydrolase (DUF442 family)